MAQYIKYNQDIEQWGDFLLGRPIPPVWNPRREYVVGDYVYHEESNRIYMCSQETTEADALNINGSTGSTASITVLSVGENGGVETFSVYDAGSGYTTGIKQTTNTTGSGTKCTVNITRVDNNGRILEVELFEEGSGYSFGEPPIEEYNAFWIEASISNNLEELIKSNGMLFGDYIPSQGDEWTIGNDYTIGDLDRKSVV